MTASDTEGNTYLFGSKQILQTDEDHGHYSLFLKMNNILVARIAIEDEIKLDAIQLIKTLKSLNIIPVLLS